MTSYAPEFDFELERARKMTRKDHKQRWVYKQAGAVHITETAIPYKDAVSVYWMPIVNAVGYSWRPRALAHNAIGAI